MITQMAERQELYKMIEALPDDSVVAMLGFIKSLRPSNGDGFYDPANIRWLERSLEQAKQGKVIEKTMEELERMMDNLA